MLAPAESPPAGVPPAHVPSLLPREHGAWGQLALPLATGLALGSPGAAALLLAVAVTLAFAAHEPLVVLAGQRGRRTRDALAARAARVLAASSAAALAAGGAALVLAPAARLAVLPAAVLGTAAVALVLARLERTTAGELLVAGALAAAAAPVALAGGAAPRAAWAATVTWIAAFTAATLPVRAVLLRARTKGEVDRRPLAAMAVAALQGSILVVASHGWLPWAAALSLLPVVVAALLIAALPVRPQRLTAVGWTIVGASLATFAGLVAALRGGS